MPEANGNGNGWRPMLIRLVGSILFGAIIMYGTVRVLSERIDSLQQDVRDVKMEIQRLRDDLYQPRVPRQGSI